MWSGEGDDRSRFFNAMHCVVCSNTSATHEPWFCVVCRKLVHIAKELGHVQLVCTDHAPHDVPMVRVPRSDGLCAEHRAQLLTCPGCEMEAALVASHGACSQFADQYHTCSQK